MISGKQNLRPSNGLTESFCTPQNTDISTKITHIGSVLSYDPIKELLESLSSKLPEEDQSVGTSKARCEPVIYWFGVLGVDISLEYDSCDPSSCEDSDDR